MGIDREIDLTSIRLILAPTSGPRVTEFARDSSTLSLSLNTFTDLASAADFQAGGVE